MKAGESRPETTTQINPLRWVKIGRRWWVSFQCRLTTWVTETANYPLILFWHEFDKALREAVPALGDELIGDAQWDVLFANGSLAENSGIDFSIRSVASSTYSLLDLDQVGTPRPENALGDIGSIERMLH